MPFLFSFSFFGFASDPALESSNVFEVSFTLTFGFLPFLAFLASLPFALTRTLTPFLRMLFWLSLLIFSDAFFLAFAAVVSADAEAANVAQSAKASRAASSRDVLVKMVSPPCRV